LTGLLDQYKMCLFLNPFHLQPGERKALVLRAGVGE
jgi:hypothetical protein